MSASADPENRFFQDPEDASKGKRLGRPSLFLLLVIATAAMLVAGADLIPSGVPGMSDHPDRFARFSLTANALAEFEDPFGWDSHIFGGYPDLQFYPPGFALLGAVLKLGLGLSLEDAYRLLVIITYLLPLFTVTALMRKLGLGPGLAVLSGFVTAFAGFGLSGTFAGVGLGVLGSRLGLGFSPLVVLYLVETEKALGSRRPRPYLAPLGLAFSLAVVVLMHPYHLLPTLLVAFIVSRIVLGGWPNLAALLGMLGGISVAGIWWAGAVLMRTWSSPFLWKAFSLEPLWRPSWGGRLGWPLLVMGAVISLTRWCLNRRGSYLAIATSIGPLVFLVLILKIVFLDLLDFEFLDPARLYDDVYFWTAAGSVCWLHEFNRRRAYVFLIGWGIAISWVIIQVPILNAHDILRPRLADLEGPHIQSLWRYLSHGRGRVMFSSSLYGGSHLFSLTGLRSGREFLGGASTNPSPLQAHLLYGPMGGTVRNIADEFDNKAVFGMTWKDLLHDSAKVRRLHGFLKDLGVTQIVVHGPAKDLPGRVLTTQDAWFGKAATFGDIDVYRVRGVEGSRVLLAPAGTVASETSSRDKGKEEVRFFIGSPGTATVRRLGMPYIQISLDGAPVNYSQGRFGQPTFSVSPGHHKIAVTIEIPRFVLAARLIMFLCGLTLCGFAAKMMLPSTRPG